MASKVDIRWNLRKLMSERGLFNTNDLLPLLAERGVQRSRMQVFRIVTETPDRFDRRVLAALCDILQCTPSDLMELCEVQTAKKKTGTANEGKVTELDPVRARIRRPRYKK
jgi:DNA-binding Xre family transcriptional regulator